MTLYWEIGHSIAQRQGSEGWGARVVDRLAHDLRAAFPDMKGFSPTNLKYMRMFAETYSSIGQRVVDQLPWGQNIVLMTKLTDPATRDWYAQACFESGWSRPILEMQIENKLYQRQGQAITNFQANLPAPR